MPPKRKADTQIDSNDEKSLPHISAAVDSKLAAAPINATDDKASAIFDSRVTKKIRRSASAPAFFAPPRYAESILYTCFVLDGLGDVGHFIDLCKAFEAEAPLKTYNPLYLLIDQKGGRESFIGASLLENNFDSKAIHIISFENSDESDKKESDTESEEENEVEKHDGQPALKKYLEGSAVFRNALSRVRLMFNFSSLKLDLYTGYGVSPLELRKFFYSNNMQVPCITIVEHGIPAPKDENSPHATYTMGFYEHKFIPLDPLENVTDKILLQSQTKITQPVELLAIQDKDFLNILLYQPNADAKSVDENRNIEAHAQKFLKTSLLIPAYFKLSELFIGGEKVLVTLVHALAGSKLTANYDEIVFVMNKDNTFDDKEMYAELLFPEIKQIIFQTKYDDKTVSQQIINNKNAVEAAITIRVIEGFWLSQHDYQIVYRCAQLFAGCSGDKSLERALNHHLLPLWQISPIKMQFQRGLIKHIYERLAEMNNIALQENLALKFFNATDCMFRATAKDYSELMALLTPELIEQWKLVLADLHANSNFYTLIPAIADHALELLRKTPSAVPRERQPTAADVKDVKSSSPRPG